ncbi:thiamine pyrophosphate-dependent enzyme [Shigella flexneri]
MPEETVVLRHWRRRCRDEHQELSTALQYELPVLVVNLNNRYLGMVKRSQDMIYLAIIHDLICNHYPISSRLAEDLWACQNADFSSA